LQWKASGRLRCKHGISFISKPKGKKKKKQVKQVGKVFVKRFNKAEKGTNGKSGGNYYHCDKPEN
jgi:hypothetical protein